MTFIIYCYKMTDSDEKQILKIDENPIFIRDS
jgi:hypothetical protein